VSQEKTPGVGSYETRVNNTSNLRRVTHGIIQPEGYEGETNVMPGPGDYEVRNNNISKVQRTTLGHINPEGYNGEL
jgi:hypothetical protein